MSVAPAQKQFNPPFDRSAPCPACQHEVRSVSALIHNFLNRCDVAEGRVCEGKAMVKLNDLRHTTFPDELTVPHPVVEELMAVGRALVDACDGMTEERGTIRWSPEITQRIEALIQRAAAAEDAFRPISDEHFADARHSSGGGVNYLRESRGGKFSGHLTKLSSEETWYDYTVEVVADGGDIQHEICGTRLHLHDHFKQNMAKDPEFYGQVWCPTCRVNAPGWQFSSPVRDT